MFLHKPSRAWCPWCVIGRARSSQHRRAREHEGNEVPVVAMDFSFITASSAPVLRMAQAGRSEAQAGRSEEATPELARQVAAVLAASDTSAMRKSDNEPAMKALARKARELPHYPTRLEETPECEPPSNALAERCVQTTKGFFRTCAVRWRAGIAEQFQMNSHGL